MSYRLFRCQQQSDLWNAARRGRITGSGVMNMIAPPTTRASTRDGVKCEAGSENRDKVTYREKLVVERLYRRIVSGFPTRAMLEGIENEPYARMLYEAQILGDAVQTVGFALHPEWDYFGCSPDSISRPSKGGQEYKCPTEMVHDRYAQNVDLLVNQYKGQSLAGLVCFPDFDWWDLYSFNGYAPDSIKLVGFRFHRSDWAETIRQIEDTAQEFNAQIEKAITDRGFPSTVFDILPDSPEAKELGTGLPAISELPEETEYGITDADWPEHWGPR